MSFKSLPRAPMAVTDVEKEHLNQTPTTSREKELQIVSLSSPSPFKLPDDWLVEERPRHSNPFHFDRYYYEPSTRRQFRSLVAVQRYLTEERDYLTTERIISENKYTTYIESRTGQRLRAYEGCLAENARRATPKSVAKSVTGKRSARGVKSSQNPAKKCFSVGEDKITSKAASIQSKHSEKTDSKKKFIFEEDESGTVHNLTRPPAKVSWVLSGPGGFWSPFLDDSVVPESEKLKWSEAFVHSIREGVINS